MMRSFNILILFVIPSCTYARFIKGSDSNDFIEWYPPLKTNSTIPPEFAWFYLTNNNQLTESTLQFLLSTEDTNFLKNNTAFYLFTEKNRHESQTLIIDDLDTLKNSNWDPLKPTRIIIHGFDTNSTTKFIVKMKDTLLDLNETSNVITFEWGKIASYIYPNAAYWTDKVGEMCGLMIDFLCKHGGQTSQFHLIGHSLGAHVAGFAAKSTSAGRIGRVTGLDPAYPGFITEGATGRLDSSDADFVDCIHTSGGLLAFQEPICGADFYPNGGYVPQPGCSGFFEGTRCSHSRSHQLFHESIMKGHLFPAMTCPELPEGEPVKCVKEGAYMGFRAESKFRGIFYLTTKAEFPFAPIVITREN